MKPLLIFFKSQPITLTALTGLLMGLAPEPLNWWGLAWVALVPLWFLISSDRPNYLKYSEIALVSFSWGFCYHSVALFWITGVHPMTWMGVPWLASLAIAIAVWLLVSCWGALLVCLWVLGFSWLTRCYVGNRSGANQSIVWAIAGKILIGVTLWCCLETIWSYSPLWWSSLSYTQSPHNLIILQLAKLSGFNTITAAIVLVNGVFAEGLVNCSKLRYRAAAIALGLLAVFHLGGWYLYNLPIAKDNLTPIKVGLIQGNIPNEIKLYSQGWSKAINGYTTGYQRLASQVDAVLTPETALPFYWDDITNNSTFYRTVKQNQTLAWVGAYGREGNSYTNSLFTLTADGQTYSRYDKALLVPLGEYIPLEPILGKIIDRLSPLEAHLQAGQPQQLFDTPFGQAIVGICYESAYSRHFRWQTKSGGQFMLTASNNAHYSNTMPAQHHAQDTIRAIESDRWMARATNTGYSAIVDPHGNTIWRSQINRYQIHADTIYQRTTLTPYVKWGDWLTSVLLLTCFGVLVILKE